MRSHTQGVRSNFFFCDYNGGSFWLIPMEQRNFHLQRMEQFLRGHFAQRGQPSGEEARPSLTISRQCGTRCDRIRRDLVEYLESIDESTVHGWACFDQSLIGKLIEEQMLRNQCVKFRPEKSRMQVSAQLAKTLQLPAERWTLFNHCANTTRSLCEIGNAIILGRAGNFVTADLANTFHVRLVGTESIRRDYTRERYNLSEEEAGSILEQVDHSRTQFVKRFADAEIGDSSHYHLVINTDHISDEILVRIIADSLIEWSQREWSDRRKIAPMPLHS
jgi:cytidylate kinase